MEAMKRCIFFIVGNYGVGKSTAIEQPVIREHGILLEIGSNLYVLGTHIRGADSVSHIPKEQVMKIVEQNNDKNIIVTGNYYAQIKDVVSMSKHFRCIIIYMATTYENNAKRIAERGKNINIDTYNSKLSIHLSMIRQTRKYSKVYIVDNNKPKEIVKQEIFKIIHNETNRPNPSTT